MKQLIFSLCVALASLVSSVASAAIVPISFNATTTTSGWSVGYNNSSNGTVLPGSFTPGSVQVVGSNPGPWVGSSNSWINPGTGGSFLGAQGWYKYSQTFSTTGVNVGIVSPLTFQVAADNHLAIRVNGNSVGSFPDSFVNNYTSTKTFSYSGAINNGINTIDFYVFNDEPDAINPTGLYVTQVSGTYENNLIIPEPASMALWGGMAGLAVLVRRRKKSL